MASHKNPPVPMVTMPSKADENGDVYCDVCPTIVARLYFKTGFAEFYTPNAEFGTMWSHNATYCRKCIPADVRDLIEKGQPA